MADWVHYATDPDGTKRFAKEDTDGTHIRLEQDISQVLERNLQERNLNDGYSKSREFRRVARIPSAVQMKWLLEEGWDCYKPECADKLMKKLNDPDWRYLRTADGHLGWSNGRFR